MFETGGDLEVVGKELTEDESYILKARYLSTEYNSGPWQWDPYYPCELWCPEDMETIIQCDIASHKREKLSKHSSVN